MTPDDIMLEAEEKMIKTEQFIQHEFAGIRTGKASPALVENIVAEAYGAQMRIRELTSITTPEPRVIMIQPYDPTTTTAIEKAIQKSNLGVNPAVQGKVIRVVLPELSQERRMELDKLVKKMAEEGRVAIRNVRREAIEHLKRLLKEHKISEDDFDFYEKDVQKLTEDYIKKIDEHLAKKEKEIMTV